MFVRTQNVIACNDIFKGLGFRVLFSTLGTPSTSPAMNGAATAKNGSGVWRRVRSDPLYLHDIV